MENFIIICLLIIAVGLAIIPTIRHFKVEGMHCEHCSNRVMEAVNSIPELSAKVKLKQGLVIISYAEPVEDNLIKEAIERIGYKVVD